eukprot:TRINITY_DN14873_c0_g1_i1.p1 TRINITY_DN14873_c0_g1~~TRINITY_DN14873_c0_g1_i1.p1  ORF type:complete len:77 (+),score=12.00 TRINITY_DN14873_c0_g1_i1:98-328(+)
MFFRFPDVRNNFYKALDIASPGHAQAAFVQIGTDPMAMKLDLVQWENPKLMESTSWKDTRWIIENLYWCTRPKGGG